MLAKNVIYVCLTAKLVAYVVQVVRNQLSSTPTIDSTCVGFNHTSA